MAKTEKKRSIFTKIRNYFIAGVVVLNTYRYDYLPKHFF